MCLNFDSNVKAFHVDQVLLEIHVCGICGTDVHFYENGRLGPWTLKEPMIIGHEASGTVKECGECVETLKPGDKVAIEPQVACRKCPLCKSGTNTKTVVC